MGGSREMKRGKQREESAEGAEKERWGQRKKGGGRERKVGWGRERRVGTVSS